MGQQDVIIVLRRADRPLTAKEIFEKSKLNNFQQVFSALKKMMDREVSSVLIEQPIAKLKYNSNKPIKVYFLKH